MAVNHRALLTTVNEGSFNVEGWVSEDYLLVTQSDMNSSAVNVLKLSRDGSEVLQIADGRFMDFIP